MLKAEVSSRLRDFREELIAMDNDLIGYAREAAGQVASACASRPAPPGDSNRRSPLATLRRFLRKGNNCPPPELAVEELLAPLDPRYRAALVSMYQGEVQLGVDGQPHPIDPLTKISPRQGLALYELCLSLKPKTTIEIGMAYGYSTLYFLAAIAKNRVGQHAAVDPFQRSQWHGIGLAHVRAVAMDSAFRLIEDWSTHAAIDLRRQNSSFDLILVDGNHRFDDVLVDFYLYAPLCKLGGLVIFDDMWMRSIQTVAAFIRSNRSDFAEVHTSEASIGVFQRVAGDVRHWDHFESFGVPSRADGR
jgi:predicted O-methyltransferase YrrM